MRASACHGADGKGQAPFMPPLAGNPAVLDPNASSLVNLVLNGAEPLVAKGVPDAYRMPQFRVQLTDEKIAAVLSFVRSAWGNNAGAVSIDQVKKMRPMTRSDQRSGHYPENALIVCRRPLAAGRFKRPLRSVTEPCSDRCRRQSPFAKDARGPWPLFRSGRAAWSPAPLQPQA